jgi:cytochrome c5
MSKTLRSQVVLALVVAIASAVSFAETGEATYKAKCLSCHGSAGVPSAGMAKMMGIKAVTDPDIKKLSVDQMIAGIKASPKMKAVSTLPDADLKDAVIFYRSLGK